MKVDEDERGECVGGEQRNVTENMSAFIIAVCCRDSHYRATFVWTSLIQN